MKKVPPVQLRSLFLKKISLCLFLFILFIGTGPLFGAEEEVPDWLKRVEFSLQVESDQKPRLYFQTVQPLHQDQDTAPTDTIFIQPRVSLQDERATYNLGLGYRKILSQDLLLGINFFGDYQDLHRHSRVGVGAEAFGQVFEMRTNFYFAGISNKVAVNTTGPGVEVERVVDGADLELGMPIPYLPWLKVYGSGFWYDFKSFSNKHGWKNRLEARLNDTFKLEFYTWDDNKGDIEYGGRLRISIAFGNPWDVADTLKVADEPFPRRNLTEQFLIPVERDFNITVERFTESNGLLVEAGRT